MVRCVFRAAIFRVTFFDSHGKHLTKETKMHERSSDLELYLKWELNVIRRAACSFARLLVWKFSREFSWKQNHWWLNLRVRENLQWKSKRVVRWYVALYRSLARILSLQEVSWVNCVRRCTHLPSSLPSFHVSETKHAISFAPMYIHNIHEMRRKRYKKIRDWRLLNYSTAFNFNARWYIAGIHFGIHFYAINDYTW